MLALSPAGALVLLAGALVLLVLCVIAWRGIVLERRAGTPRYRRK